MNSRRIICLLFLTFMIACDSGKGPSSQPSDTVKKPVSEPPFVKEGELWFIGNEGDTLRHIDIEIAEDESERTLGLMHRRTLPDTRGMLFIFEEEEPRSFWMHNTLIGLDIIYVRENGTIESIAAYAVPKNDRSIPSKGPAMYVVEVFEGFCDRYNVKVGDRVVWRRS